MLLRILLFLSPAIGHSIERVHALAMLYDEITVQAAERMLALWQALRPPERARAAHQPLHADDETAARPRATPVQRSGATIAAAILQRRNAS
jgi:hypothetical protein